MRVRVLLVAVVLALVSAVASAQVDICGASGTFSVKPNTGGTSPSHNAVGSTKSIKVGAFADRRDGGPYPDLVGIWWSSASDCQTGISTSFQMRTDSLFATNTHGNIVPGTYCMNGSTTAGDPSIFVDLFYPGRTCASFQGTIRVSTATFVYNALGNAILTRFGATFNGVCTGDAIGINGSISFSNPGLNFKTRPSNTNPTKPGVCSTAGGS